MEVVDEMALRTFDLHPTGDGEGNLTGLADIGLDEMIGFALSRTAMEAWQAAAPQSGLRVLGASGPHVRPRDATGAYSEIAVPRMPFRRDDGSFIE